MTTVYQQRLKLLRQLKNNKLLSDIRHGIEREGLRVSGNAHISNEPHPSVFGKALTHPHITTDFSEALLEYITPVYSQIDEMFDFLGQLHRYTAQHMGSEVLWAGSMPCLLGDAKDIPIAQYGHSNIGKMKTIYREGLSNRYGKAMQTIAGLHYNFSLPDDIWPLLGVDQSQGYLAQIRNFNRYSWLLMYLFGASPAVSRTFFADGDNSALNLERLNNDTLYLPYATSLRMSDMGYSNNAQSFLTICYNSLDNYIDSLSKAMTISHEDYQRIGVKVDGQYRQLNANLLQIENEYYSNIRPKRVTRSGEKPLTALKRHGPEYIEVRCIDINPFEALGLSSEDAHFLDVFLLYCALDESKPINNDECLVIKENFTKTVLEGRNPDLTLQHNAKAVSLPVWATELLDNMFPVAQLLDSATGKNDFAASIQQQKHKIADPKNTPSAKILAMLESSQQEYTEQLLKLSQHHHQQFKARPLSREQLSYFEQVAKALL